MLNQIKDIYSKVDEKVDKATKIKCINGFYSIFAISLAGAVLVSAPLSVPTVIIAGAEVAVVNKIRTMVLAIDK